MNFTLHENISRRQRCRNWTPIVTQQLRLRHLYQIIAYNLSNECTGGFYYTLHSTAMCAPFYTSQIISCDNPKWAEIEIIDLPNPASTAFVLRIWNNSDIKVTWGINLSGLVYLGNKLSDIQPDSFSENTVILYLRGGYFTSLNNIRRDIQKPLPFIDHLNVISTENRTNIFKSTSIKAPSYDIKSTYDLDKLRKLHSLQLAIKNRSLEVQALKEKINYKSNGGSDSGSSETTTKMFDSNIRYAPQLLTMTSLNKMLQDKPTKVQKKEIVRIQKEIELSKLKNKMLSQEKDRKQGQIRQLKYKYCNLCDENEDRNSQLMENYRKLSKEIERLREWKKEHHSHKEILHHLTSKLQFRRRQLMSELLYLYPIETVKENKYVINGIYLPSSDILSDCSDSGLSVALGYISHILIMCASILQVPLRYPLHFFGSRSSIEDQITASLSDKSREFPLYTRGKDRMQFNYAVYLLNKNIAQYLYLLGARTPDLKATLPNVLQLLQGKENKHDISQRSLKSSDAMSDSTSVTSHETLRFDPEHSWNTENRKPFSSSNNISDPVLDSIRQECQMEKSESPVRGKRKISRTRLSETGPGLSQILAIPEAYLNKQMSSSSFINYMTSNLTNLENSSATKASCLDGSSIEKAISDENCDIKSLNIEEAKEMIPPEETIEKSTKTIDISQNGNDNLLNNSKRLSRSLGSYTDEDKSLELRASFEIGSDPLLNVSSDTSNIYTSEAEEAHQQEFLHKWLESGPSLISYEENLYPEEVLGTTAHTSTDSPLTMRTDALLKTKSFNLIKPKY